jgi:NADPH:quinone reductase
MKSAQMSNPSRLAIEYIKLMQVAYTGTATYAEFTAVNPDFTVVLPDEMTHESGSALLLQGMTAVMLARLAYTVKKGDNVLIHACAGGTGLLLVQICKHYGATVIGSTSTEAKKELALKAG